MTVNITLPNGRTVNTGTKEGANYFIQDPSGPFEFFSQNLEHVKQVCDRIYHRRNKTPTPQEINEIGLLYTVASQLAENADYDVFAKIPVNEIHVYMEHIKVEIARMTEANSNWARTGALTHYHEQMLLEGLIGLAMQRVPIKLAFEMDFFGTLAMFASAPSTVAVDPAETITMIVANVAISTLVYKEELPSTAKVFAKLESCGMLEQFIRLSVVCPMSSPGVLKCYDQLHACSSFIEKKFTDDQPCGKACKEILGRSSLNRHPVVGKLRMIASFTNWIEKRADLPKEMRDGYRYCRKCNKMEHSPEFQRSLQKCSRCKSAWYCSRECQVGDWKAHKPFCRAVTSKASKVMRFNEQSVHDFIKDNYITILEEIVKVSSATGKKKGELLLELDFFDSSKYGRGAPALQTPPKFKIADSKGYFEGSRPNEPDWFYKHIDRKCYDGNVPMFVRGLKDTYNRLTDSHLLVLVRPPDNQGFGVYRMQLQSSTTKNHMFSQRTIDAATKAIEDEDFDPLTSLFGEGSDDTQRLRRALGGPPDEATLDAVRAMLNMNFGGSF
mmetsp:Transcript_17429/g.26225  ORF Transcript_17429/g.26225 Transcript_17429/m.26225 type:complete len:555 (-) Transcript_17429:64-1728(-)